MPPPVASTALMPLPQVHAIAPAADLMILARLGMGRHMDATGTQKSVAAPLWAWPFPLARAVDETEGFLSETCGDHNIHSGDVALRFSIVFAVAGFITMAAGVYEIDRREKSSAETVTANLTETDSESEPSAIKFVFLMINIRGRSTPTRESFKRSVFKFKPLPAALAAKAQRSHLFASFQSGIGGKDAMRLGCKSVERVRHGRFSAS